MGAPRLTDAAAHIDALAADPKIGGNTLSDLHHTVTYAEVPELLDRVEEHWASHSVAGPRVVALECSQSVAGALAVLHALHRGDDVVLLPEPSDKVPRVLPSFCTHVMTATEAPADPGAAFPEGHLHVTPNDSYAPEPLVADFEGPDIYLRTSGSTAASKLARMSHAKWLQNAAAGGERWGITAADRVAIPVPIFHAYGLGAAFLPGLLAGASMDLISDFNILRYLEREKRFNPNVAYLTPALCGMFVRVRKSDRPYRLTVTAGDKVAPETVAAFELRFGPLLNLYGSGEMGAVSSSSPADPLDVRLGTAGYAMRGVELSVDESGKLFCRRDDSFAGYLIQADDGWRFAPHDGAYETGDLARIRDDGYVEILGRFATSVNRDGRRVVVSEVEAAIESLDGCAQAVVVGEGESRRGTRLHAFCMLDKNADTTAEELRSQCFDKLPL
ncbi:MAG: fatty acid--CoA ligase family protein, partial [Acidobacteriota bacterium]